jgi:hypothetical protein
MSPVPGTFTLFSEKLTGGAESRGQSAKSMEHRAWKGKVEWLKGGKVEWWNGGMVPWKYGEIHPTIPPSPHPTLINNRGLHME